MAGKRSRKISCAAIILSAFAAAAWPGSAAARTPPPESATKVARVLLYGKIGGWLSPDAITEVKRIFRQMSVAKGFILDTAKDESALTPENLARYQAIVWNNNSNGGASVKDSSARRAVLEYVKGGGGWLLVGLAGDHADTWTDLSDLLGSKATYFLGPANADIRADSSAKRHPELRHVVSAIPDTVRLWNEWLLLQGNARPLRGVTVLYTAGNGDAVSLPPGGSKGADYPYVWARDVGKGRLLFNALGPWAGNVTTVATQSDSAITKMYWQSLRWLAGDFKNGCTDPGSPLFDPEARIDDASCSGTGVRPVPRGRGNALAVHGRTVRLAFRADRETSFDLRNIQGALIGHPRLSQGMDEVRLGAAVPAGLYVLEARAMDRIARYRLFVP